jgi:putative PIG3 family NAD(P)H quinone oxidoreductase
MRAVVFDEPGDESVLRVDEVSEPELRPGTVRIEVAAAGVNRADLLQRRGLYPPPVGASTTLGLECAGTVLEAAGDVEGIRVGEPVMALLTGGGYAEQAVVEAECLLHVPSNLNIIQAAAVPEVYLTAFLNLVELGELEPGSTALVHGGSGGVGTAATQIGTRAGARILVTAGSDERCRRCAEIGADAAFNHRAEDFVARCLDHTGGGGVDVVLDCIGAGYLSRNLEILKPDGRLVVIGMMGGARAELDLARLLTARLTVIGSTLRGRTPKFKGGLIGRFLDRFGPDMESGAIRPVIDRVLAIEDVAEAHRALAAGEIFGKLVLKI